LIIIIAKAEIEKRTLMDRQHSFCQLMIFFSKEGGIGEILNFDNKRSPDDPKYEE